MESIRWQKNNLKQYFEDDDYSEDEVMRIYLPYRFKLKKPEKIPVLLFIIMLFQAEQ